MGPAGLTAVFGMGTGVAPRVWSPGNRAARAFNLVARDSGWAWSIHDRGFGRVLHSTRRSPLDRENACCETRIVGSGGLGPSAIVARSCEGVGSGWSSRSAVRTGRLRRSPALHFRPIDLVVFQEPTRKISAGDLISRKASRLDAFSAYPVPTWLPGGALSRTAGTPEVGPPQSSRTRGDAPQVSYAHGR